MPAIAELARAEMITLDPQPMTPEQAGSTPDVLTEPFGKDLFIMVGGTSLEQTLTFCKIDNVRQVDDDMTIPYTSPSAKVSGRIGGLTMAYTHCLARGSDGTPVIVADDEK